MFLKSLTLKGFKSFADSTLMALEPGVTVVVSNEKLGVKDRGVVTDLAGNYRIPGLSPGTYHMVVSFPTFATIELDLVVEPGKTARGAGRTQVIALGFGKFKKVLRNLCTDNVCTEVLGAGFATSGSEKSGFRLITANFQLFS